MIRVTRPIDMRVGDLIYCGIGRGKRWRRIERIEVKSCWRYSVFMEGHHSISMGSGLKYLVKSTRPKCDF